LPIGAQKPHQAADSARNLLAVAGRTGQFVHVRQGAARQVTEPLVWPPVGVQRYITATP